MKAEKSPDLGDDGESCSLGTTGEGEENDAKVVISTNKDSQKENVVEVMRL